MSVKTKSISNRAYFAPAVVVDLAVTFVEGQCCYQTILYVYQSSYRAESPSSRIGQQQIDLKV